jgi:hypothetical protein
VIASATSHDLRRFALVALVLNLIWEMAQMGSYTAMDRSFLDTLPLCFAAAVGDAIILTILYLLTGRMQGAGPEMALSWNRMATLAVLGAVVAAGLEAIALILGLWQYGRSMPLVPGTRIGILPVLQFALLGPGTLWLVKRRAGIRR